jgi:hypothetical protein
VQALSKEDARCSTVFDLSFRCATYIRVGSAFWDFLPCDIFNRFVLYRRLYLHGGACTGCFRFGGLRALPVGADELLEELGIINSFEPQLLTPRRGYHRSIHQARVGAC